MAECDIKGFFDSISHEVASQSLVDLTAAALTLDGNFTVDPRALRIFHAFLACYNFPRNVKHDTERALKMKNGRNAYFKWPKDELRVFHPNLSSVPIGIPQGGALSCFIANCVLHQADTEVERCHSRSPEPFKYLRYCDDMVIISPDRETCRLAFASYQYALARLRLPIHAPAGFDEYTESFWSGKSRQTYVWAKPERRSVVRTRVPWIQFVGYQMRYDGMLRVKKKSIQKHKLKILQETSRLLRKLYPEGLAGGASPCIRKTAKQIEHRFRQKLIAMSVGRRDVHHDLSQMMPKCWSSGFKRAHGSVIPLNALKELDRFREMQIHRIVNRLRIRPPRMRRADSPENIPVPRYYGFPFSYVAQFIGGRR